MSPRLIEAGMQHSQPRVARASCENEGGAGRVRDAKATLESCGGIVTERIGVV